MIARRFTMTTAEANRRGIRHTTWHLGSIYRSGRRIRAGWYLRIGLTFHCLVRNRYADVLEDLT